MEDPDEDWDVEAELQRQLDALESPTDNDHDVDSLLAPESAKSSSRINADGESSSTTTSASDASKLQEGAGNMYSDVSAGGDVLGHLEALLKERAKKFDDFYGTLEAIREPEVVASGFIQPVSADVSLGKICYQSTPRSANSPPEPSSALVDTVLAKNLTDSVSLKTGAISKVPACMSRHREQQLFVGTTPVGQDQCQALGAEREKPDKIWHHCTVERQDKETGGTESKPGPLLCQKANTAFQASKGGQRSASPLALQELSVSANRPPAEERGITGKQHPFQKSSESGTGFSSGLKLGLSPWDPETQENEVWSGMDAGGGLAVERKGLQDEREKREECTSPQVVAIADGTMHGGGVKRGRIKRDAVHGDCIKGNGVSTDDMAWTSVSRDGANADGVRLHGVNADDVNGAGVNGEGVDGGGVNGNGVDVDGVNGAGVNADGVNADGGNADGVNVDKVNGPAGDLRSESLHLEYQVQLDSLQERHVRVTSEIELARREELARQAEEAALERARRAAAAAVARKNEEERRRRVLERERRMQVIQAELERATREAFAAKRIARAYRAHRASVRNRSAVRLQSCARGFLARRAYFDLCIQHSRELLRDCEARNNIRALEAAAARARALGLAAEADAALQRTRSREEEARAAVAAAAAQGGLEDFERGREWAVSAGVAPAEVAAAEALFGRRVSEKLASIDSGIGQGLPLVNLQILMREAQSLGVNKGRLDQFDRDVLARDRAAVQELDEAARVGSYRGSGGFDEAVRKARGFGLLEDVETAEATMNARRERVLEGLTRVIELDLGGQPELTRLLDEAVRLDMGDAAKAAEHRCEEQVKNWVSELSEVARTGSRSRFANLVRELRQRGREDGIETAKAVLGERLSVTRQGLASAAERGTKPEIEKWINAARELDLVGEIQAAKKVQAARVRTALDAWKSALREDCRGRLGCALDTSSEHAGIGDGAAEAVSSAKRDAERLGVPAALLTRLSAAVESEERVKNCRGTGGFGGVYARDGSGHPILQINDGAAATCQEVTRKHDVIVTALGLQLEGTHQFLANGGGSLRRSGLDDGNAEPSDEDRTVETLSARKGVPIWPHPMDWGEIERLRSHWQRSVSSEPSDGASITDGGKASVDDVVEGESSGEEEGHVAADEGLRSRKFQAALTEDAVSSVDERLDSNQKAGTSGRETGPQLTRPLLEAVAGGLGFLGALQTLDLALEGLRGLGPKGQLGKWCPSLTSLRLDVNRMTSLAGCFDELERTLETLSVKDNQVTSLRGLEGLKSLRTLRLDANIIQRLGVDADVIKGSLWPSLTELGLSANRLTGISGLGGVCANLELLELAGNGLTRLEGVLRGLPRLRVLDVSRNKLRGRSLWSELSRCPLLTSLVASFNKLTDLPSGAVFAGSVLLRELWLNGNGIRRMEALCWLPNLQRLYLQDNAIEGVGPLWGFLNLEVLDLSFNCISDPGDLRHLGCLRSLRTLQLNDNPVASPGHSYPSAVLSAVPWLRELDNEPVTDVLRETVLRGLITGRAGLLTSFITKVRQQETRGISRKLVLLPAEESVSDSEEGPEEDLALLEEGSNSAEQTDPPTRVKAMWGHVLKAVELAEREGFLRERQPAARAAGLQHQALCAEWRARLARAARARESAPGGEQPFPGGLEPAGLEGLPVAGNVNVNADRAGSEVEPLDGDDEGGVMDGQILPSENGRSLSLLVQQLRRCVLEHARFAAASPGAAAAPTAAAAVTPSLEASEKVTSAQGVSDFGEGASDSRIAIRRNERYYEQEERKCVELVTRIQACWRGRRDRIRSGLLAAQRKATQSVAAVRIQAFWRGFTARRMKTRHVVRETAARTVQARWRGHFLRKKISAALLVAKFVDEDDEFGLGGGEDLENLLAGFEGLSRPGTGPAAVQRSPVRRNGWVSPVGASPTGDRGESTAGRDRTGSTIDRVPRGMSRGFGDQSGEELLRVRTRSSVPTVLAPLRPTEGKRNRTERSGTEQHGTEQYGTERSGAEWSGADRGGAEKSGVEWSGTERDVTEQGGPERNGMRRNGLERNSVETESSKNGLSRHLQTHATNLKSATASSPEVEASYHKLTSDSRKGTSRSPLLPINTAPPRPNAVSLNSPQSSVVPLPTLSPKRASTEENKPQKGRVSLPVIRLSSGPPDLPGRTSKRLSEPLARSLDASDETTLRDDVSIQSTPRGPHVPRSERKLVKQRESISEIAQEWGFKDDSTAAAALRARDRRMRNAQQERRRKSLQDPEKRLQLFKAQARQQGSQSAPRPSHSKPRPAWAKSNASSDEEGSSDDCLS